MRIGIDYDTIAYRRPTAEEVLDLAGELDLSGVQFLDPSQIDPELDPDTLSAFRQRADDRGLYLEVGLPSPNPFRASLDLRREVRPAELTELLHRHVEAVAALGCTHARLFVGGRHDRFRIDTRWPDQQVASLEVLRRLAPHLREVGVRVAVENHADFTADELLQFVAAVGDDVAGITLDTGNLPLRLDDPIPATERLAPLVLSVHAKDAVLAFHPRGLCWQSRAVGDGILPMSDLIGIIHRSNPNANLSIELHPGTIELPIYDRQWLDSFSGLRPSDLAAIVRLASQCEERYRDESRLTPEQLDAVPWAQRDLDGLARSVGYLRPLVSLLDNLSTHLRTSNPSRTKSPQS
jgi:sugar phosphate isomerase/epimerase